jgi:hypothetical protein
MMMKRHFFTIFINEVATRSGSFLPDYRLVAAGNNLQQHSEEAKSCEKERTL